MLFKFGSLHSKLRRNLLAHKRATFSGMSFGESPPRRNKLTERINKINAGFCFRRSLRIDARDFLDPRNIAGAHFFVYSG